MSRNEQPPTCRNAACGNQILTIAYKNALNGGTAKKIQCPWWHRDITGKELWNGENDEVS